MSARSFRPVIAVATVATAALGCYLVSLRVATERASLEDVETKIVLAQRDIRMLRTEIGTRGRLEQLERWNVKVLALSAPKADQFLDGGYQLARLARPSDEVNMNAPVVLASAPKPKAGAPMPDDDAASLAEATTPPAASVNEGPASIMHVASYSVSGKPSGVPVKPAPRAQTAPSTKPVKIATSERVTDLPATRPPARASLHRAPGKPGSAKDKATH